MLKLTTKTPERRQWRRTGVFIVNFEYIPIFSDVSIVDFEQEIFCWDKETWSHCANTGSMSLLKTQNSTDTALASLWPILNMI